MTKFAYTSTTSENTLVADTSDGLIEVVSGQYGLSVRLTSSDAQDLAFSLLHEQYEMHENFDGTVTLRPKGLPVPTNNQAVIRTAYGIGVLADSKGGPDLPWVFAKPDGSYDWVKTPGPVLEIIHPGVED